MVLNNLRARKLVSNNISIERLVSNIILNFPMQFFFVHYVTDLKVTMKKNLMSFE